MPHAVHFSPGTILRGARRAALVIVIAVLALEAGYVLFGNLFLSLGGVRLFFKSTELVDVQLTRGSGGPLSFRGRVQRLEQTLHGALLFRLSALTPISLGVDIDHGKTGLSLGAGSAWLSRKLVRLEESARANRAKPCKKSQERRAE